MKFSTIGSILRSNQAYYSQISATETLECGIAYWSAAYPSVPEANQFREVMLPDAGSMPRAFAEAEQYFAARGLRCQRWAPAAEQSVEVLQPFLESRGYRRRELRAMRLGEWPHIPPNPAVRILPARAMRAAHRQTYSQDIEGRSHDEPSAETRADLANERLDDPQLDMFVALVGGQPAGRCALFQVGDIGRIIDFYVPPALRRQGIATALLAHVIALAQRVASRVICLEVDATNVPAHALLAKLGFHDDGMMVEFDAPPTAGMAT
jgi:GNAT superfamily N-acetyltransferase